MTWRRRPVADGLIKAFQAADSPVSPSVALLDQPRQTFNVPALIVSWTDLVEPFLSSMKTDRVDIPVICAVGSADMADDLDDLAAAAQAAILADRTLGGVVQTCAVRQWRNQRPMKVGGADYLVMDLLLEIRM